MYAVWPMDNGQVGVLRGGRGRSCVVELDCGAWAVGPIVIVSDNICCMADFSFARSVSGGSRARSPEATVM